MVLSGEGKHFCSGMDLEVFTSNDAIGPSGQGDQEPQPGHRSSAQ